MAGYSIFNGADNALRDIRKLKLFAPDEFARALYQEALIELKEIKLRTPVDTGALRASEQVTEPQRDGRRIWVTVIAGGPTVTYAFVVHEDLEAFHRVGEAKFIERPLAESAPYLGDRIAKRIDLNRAL
jgi:hypothetical protein